MVNVTARKITFHGLTSSKMVQEMFESYFDNTPSVRINEQINSFIIQNKPLIKLNAIKAFRELLIFDDVSTICFLSALRRYLKIDNNINSNDKNEQISSKQFVMAKKKQEKPLSKQSVCSKGTPVVCRTAHDVRTRCIQQRTTQLFPSTAINR